MSEPERAGIAPGAAEGRAVDDRPVRVGVRELARFALRRGDLEIAPAGPSARDGQLAHQRVQQEAMAVSGSVEAEVVLQRQVELDGRVLVLGGRVDLFDRERSRLIEIKSTLVPPDRLMPGRRVLDRAQLALYAWMLGDEVSVDLELLYVNLRDDSRSSDVWRPDRATLDREVVAALGAWLAHARRLEVRRRALSTSCASLVFPQRTMRAGQRRMAVAAYRAIRDGESLLVEAPTGTGKTLGMLYPAIRALGERHVERLCWLTAKRSGREAALAATRQLIEAGLVVDVLVLRARRDGCRCERDPERRMADGRCPESIGFHDRLPAARADAIGEGTHARLLDGDALDALAARHRLCAHALADELLPESTLVICDFNHVLDPVAARATLHDADRPTAVLIDEAHQLPARSRSMFSARLSRTDCMAALQRARTHHPGVARTLERLVETLRVHGREAALTTALTTAVTTAVPPSGASRSLEDHHDVRVASEASSELLRAFGMVLERLVEARESEAVDAPVEPTFAMALHRMQAIGQLFGAVHRELVQARTIGGRREVIVDWACLDASECVGKVLARQGTTLAFSAALGPPEDFRDALGLDRTRTRALAVESPFDAARLHAQLIDWIPVSFRDRERSEEALVDLIVGACESRAGHWIVFVPSHAWLTRLYTHVTRRHGHLECWRQSEEASGTQVQHRLERLARPGATLGFAITGGVFGEGVDYVGERLIGAIVVGIGLAPRDVLSGLMIEHHERANRRGYDLVCRQPALLRTLQSGGRVIRGADERGALLLVDARFGDGYHRAGLPAHWTMRRPANLSDACRQLRQFWQSSSADVRSGSMNRDGPERANARGIERCPGRSGRTSTAFES